MVGIMDEFLDKQNKNYAIVIYIWKKQVIRK